MDKQARSNTRSARTSATTRSSARSTSGASVSCGSRSGSACVLVWCCCSRRGSTSSCCATATGSNRCSAIGPPRTTSTATCGSKSKRCARRSASRSSRPSGWAWSRPAPATPSSSSGSRRTAAGQVARRRAGRTKSGWLHQPHLTWRPRSSDACVVAAGRSCVLGRRHRGAAGRAAGRGNHDGLVARAERQQNEHATRARQARRDLRPAWPLAGLQRRCRHHLRGPHRNRGSKTKAAAALCRVLDDCDKKFREQLLERLSRQARLRVREAARRAARSQARRRPRARGHRLHEREPALLSRTASSPRTCSATSASTTSACTGIEATYDNIVRGREGKLLVQTDARGHAFGRLGAIAHRRRLARAHDRRAPAVHRRARAAGRRRGRSAPMAAPRSSWIRTAARSSRWPAGRRSIPIVTTRRDERPPQSRRAGPLRAGLDVQARHRIGGPRRGRDPADDLIDVSAGIIRFRRRKPIDDFEDHNYGILSFTDVIVKSSNVGAIKIGLKVGPERIGLVHHAVLASAGRSSPDFPGESPGIVWDPAKLDDSALASMSMGYQVGVTPLQMAAAASAVANGGTLDRAACRARRDQATASAPVMRRKPCAARFIPRPRADAHDRSWNRSSQDGTGKRAKLPGYTVAGKTGTGEQVRERPLFVRPQQNVSFLGFVPSRNPVLTVIVMIDSPRVGGDTGGVDRRADLPAHCRMPACGSSACCRPSIPTAPCSWRVANVVRHRAR